MAGTGMAPAPMGAGAPRAGFLKRTPTPGGIDPTVSARSTTSGPSSQNQQTANAFAAGQTPFSTAAGTPSATPWASAPGPGGTPTTNNGAFTQNLSTTGRMSQATLQAGQEAQQGRSQFEDLLSGGQNALNNYATSAMNAAMPNFDAQLQDLNESAQRRGVGNGGLSTSYQGDLAGAMQRNIANAVGAQSMNLYGTQLGATQNQMNVDTSNYGSGLENAYNIATARKNKKSSLFGALGAAGGGTLGGILGGPFGAAAGSALGGSLGSSLGS